MCTQLAQSSVRFHRRTSRVQNGRRSCPPRRRVADDLTCPCLQPHPPPTSHLTCLLLPLPSPPSAGGQEKLRPLWRHYFNNTDGLIFVVDCQDRERIDKAAAEFQAIIQDPLMLQSSILIFANKQDMRGALAPAGECGGWVGGRG